MPKPLTETHGEKVARKVIAQAVRWTKADLSKGRIDRKVYDERMARIDAERKACGF